MSPTIPTEPRSFKKAAHISHTNSDGISKVESTISRCVSVPSAMHLAVTQGSGAPVPTRFSEEHKMSRHDSSSVKHLTCFWWKEKGSCRFSDTDCLYAHYDTGHYTDPPRQLVPGEPALAGRKLDKAMRNLVTAHRSSGSLPSLAESRHNSRSVTPVFDYGCPFPSPVSPISESDLVRLRNDNQFLKSLVDQGMKEKSVMLNTIETLQADLKDTKASVDALRNVHKQLLIEREDLHTKIRQLENLNLPARATSCPFGTTGRARVNTETRYLGGLLDNE